MIISNGVFQSPRCRVFNLVREMNAVTAFSGRVAGTCHLPCLAGHFWAPHLRSYVSERFEVLRQGKKLSFTSKKSDSDVILALQSLSSDFAKHIHKAGTEGMWSANMRAWAHYLSQDAKTTPEERTAALDAAGVFVRVDSRERKLIECLRNMMEIPFTVETLRVGDLVIGSFPYEIFIERKAVPDLVQSMFDSRLFNQLGNQLHQTRYDRLHSLVVVEGDLSQLQVESRAMQKLSYQQQRRLAVATMVRLCLRDQIPVLRTQDLAGTAELVCTIVQEYPKLMQMRPLQYGQRKERPFRPRRGEDPKEALASQLRCVRGVSETVARSLAKKHSNMKSFISAMMDAEDPVQWLVEKGSGGDSRWSRSTAVLLAKSLAGEDAVARENLICSLEAINGLTRMSAKTLVQKFHTRAKLQSFFQGQNDPVGALYQLLPKLNLPARMALVEEVAGKEALAFEEYKRRLASVHGISAATVVKISAKFPSAAALCQALIRKDGPDPVSRAVQMTQISFPAALNLVSEFMDGSALNLARLMKDISKVNGISTKTAQNVATAFEGNRKQLVKALRQDLGEAKGAKRARRGLRTGLTNLQMQNVLGELQRP